MVNAYKFFKRAGQDNLAKKDIDVLKKLADDLAEVLTLVAKFDGNLGLVKV
jgi:hypothetical protein